MNKSVLRMTFVSILVAQALVLHVVEGMIPVPIPVPGARLGLANIFSLISLYTLGFGPTFLVVVLRVILATMFGGNLSSFMYSLSGGILSFLMMALVKNVLKDRVSILGVSGAGAVSHNIGQLMVASAIVRNAAVMLYLPVLTFIGIGTGIFIGITSNVMMFHLNKIPTVRKIREAGKRNP